MKKPIKNHKRPWKSKKPMRVGFFLQKIVMYAGRCKCIHAYQIALTLNLTSKAMTPWRQNKTIIVHETEKRMCSQDLRIWRLFLRRYKSLQHQTPRAICAWRWNVVRVPYGNRETNSLVLDVHFKRFSGSRLRWWDCKLVNRTKTTTHRGGEKMRRCVGMCEMRTAKITELTS